MSEKDKAGLYHVPNSRVVHANKDCQHAKRADEIQQVVDSGRKPCYQCMIAQNHEYVEDYYAL